MNLISFRKIGSSVELFSLGESKDTSWIGYGVYFTDNIDKIKEKGLSDIFSIYIPNKDRFLNLDKSLKEQSDYIKELLSKFDSEISGSQLYDSFRRSMGSAENVSKHLNDLGINGLYTSRDNSLWSTMFVIWDDSILENMRRVE
jgi:hypothetical protein